MMKLIPYELRKIWGRRSFQMLTCLLVALNLFLLWYLNVPGENDPPLSAYRAVCADLSDKSEDEKLAYLSAAKEKIDGVALVDEIMTLQGRGDEMGAALAEQLRQENPDAVETYFETYTSGDYLRYTDSLEKEKALLSELYAEIEAVSGYDDYLVSIQQSKDELSGISIFSNSQSAFSSRNIDKSATDHAGLTSAQIRWYPSKGISMALESRVTDLFLLLSVFLFVGSLVTEEKEQGIFSITRPTKNGVSACMGAKLAALLLHCLVVTALLYVSSLAYAGMTTGLCDFSAALQSVASFIESSLSISLFEYTAFSILTKALVLFCFGALLAAVSLFSSRRFVPQLFGIGWLFANGLAYALIPAYSVLNPLKYLSFWGLMQTRRLYGEYLNFNLMGHAVSRLPVALTLIGVLFAAGVGLCLLLFRRGWRFEMRKARRSPCIPFRAHGNLLAYEGYKILFTSRALVILLLFAALIGYRELGKTYSPSISEQYYQNIMLQLEGEPNGKKEALISAEQSRYDEAFAEIERIDAMAADGEIDKHTAEDLKTPWYAETTFYPSFQRVLQQYEHISANGGVFVYDTGYRYLFGTMDNSFLIDLLLLALCMAFALSNVMAMEYQKKSWNLLSATAVGKRRIVQKKLLVCTLCAVVMAVLPWIFRIVSIAWVYPMHEWDCAVTNIPQYFAFAVEIPVWAFLVLGSLMQVLTVVLDSAVVVLLSWRCKNYFQALFLSMIILAVPLVLTLMGIGQARWFSAYPLYNWVANT